VLEDIQNPNFAISEIFRVSQKGYIETPSPLIEITYGVEKSKIIFTIDILYGLMAILFIFFQNIQ